MKKDKEEGWIDIHNDALMVKLGIRPPILSAKDTSIWSKTKQEQKNLPKAKHNSTKNMHFSIPPEKSIPVVAKLIVYLKKNSKYPNTTYSTTCKMNKIGNIINNYYSINKHTKVITNLVSKYSYNGKTYNPKERPFWSLV